MYGLRRGVKITLTLLATVLLWEILIGVFSVPVFVVPPPSAIAATMAAKPDLLAAHSFVTLYETLGGFVLGVAGGILAAALIVVLPALRDIIMPLLLIAQIVPKVAIAPVLLIWFGYGATPKLLIAFLVAFFPVVVNTASGLTSVEPEMLDLGRSLEASRWQIFRMFQIPTALPHLFSGMKISVTLAVIGAVIGEFVGGSKGLGYLIIVANQELNTALAFAALFLLSVVGIALYGLVEVAERLLIPWGVSEDPWKEAGAGA